MFGSETGQMQLQPIASITKLMTAMVVLDANMNLQESITIVS